MGVACMKQGPWPGDILQRYLLEWYFLEGDLMWDELFGTDTFWWWDLMVSILIVNQTL